MATETCPAFCGFRQSQAPEFHRIIFCRFDSQLASAYQDTHRMFLRFRDEAPSFLRSGYSLRVAYLSNRRRFSPSCRAISLINSRAAWSSLNLSNRSCLLWRSWRAISVSIAKHRAGKSILSRALGGALAGELVSGAGHCGSLRALPFASEAFGCRRLMLMPGTACGMEAGV